MKRPDHLSWVTLSPYTRIEGPLDTVAQIIRDHITTRASVDDTVFIFEHSPDLTNYLLDLEIEMQREKDDEDTY